MKAAPVISAARHFTTVVGVLLIALVLVAWRHGTLDIISAVRSSLLNTEATLRDWFSALRLR
jgi:hypothetical protein